MPRAKRGDNPERGPNEAASSAAEDGVRRRAGTVHDEGSLADYDTAVTLSSGKRVDVTIRYGMEAGVRSSLVGRIERWLRRSLDRMSDDEVLRAVEAQSPAETIAEILAATPEARSASDADWAELLLRGAESKRLITELVGGLLTSSEAAEVLRISIPGVKQRMDRRKLLAVPLPGGQWGFPSLQFDLDGKVRPGVPEVAKAGSHIDPWVVLSILVDDVEDGRGGMLLERLDDPAVLADVLNRFATYGFHGAA